MTEPTPAYASTVQRIRKDHVLEELNLMGTAADNVNRCRTKLFAIFAVRWDKMTEVEQNAYFADVRDFRLRLEALTCGEEG